MKDLSVYIDKAMKNIDSDRAAAKALLTDLMIYVKNADERQREVGMIAAKYLETLQRSNEQMVKLSALLQKQQGGVNGLSEEDKADLYDMLNEEEVA